MSGQYVDHAAQDVRLPGGQREIISGLVPFYAALGPLTEPLIRIAAGLFLMPHGAQKLFGLFGGDPVRLAGLFSKIGLEPGWLWVASAGSVEFFCGLAIAVGFLTRPAAIGAVILLGVALKVQSPFGWFWTGGGIEYAALWLLVMLTICVRGGGRFSVDRLIGREL